MQSSIGDVLKNVAASFKCSNALIYGLFLLLCPMDNLNALLQKDFGLSGTPAQIYKMLLFFACIYGMRVIHRRIAWLLVLYALSMTLVHGFTSPMAEFGWLINDFGFTFKCIYAYVVALYISDSGNENYERIVKVMFVSFGVLTANLILGILGFGYSQYAGGVGTLGYFIAGNEMSGMQLILTSFVAAFMYRQRMSVYVLVSIFLIALGIIKGTKTGAIGVLIIVLMTPIMMGGIVECRIHAKRLGILLLLGFLTLPLLGFIVVRLISKIGILDRFIWFLVHKGILGAIFSDRELRVVPFLNEFCERWGIASKLFGYGFPDGRFYGFKELDVLDLLFTQGSIGLVLIYIAWMAAFLYALNLARNGNRFAAQGTLLIVILLVLSNLSGHIVYSGLAMPFFGVYLGSLKIINHWWRKKTSEVICGL